MGLISLLIWTFTSILMLPCFTTGLHWALVQMNVPTGLLCLSSQAKSLLFWTYTINISVSVISCCVINHPNLGGLKQQLFYLIMLIWAWCSCTVLLALPWSTHAAAGNWSWVFICLTVGVDFWLGLSLLMDLIPK